MTRRRSFALIAALGALSSSAGMLVPAGVGADGAPVPGAPIAGAPVPAAPTHGPLYVDGPDGRYLLDGPWLFRSDPGDSGLAQGLQSSESSDGWSTVTVPNAWNANDNSAASFAGGVVWYRKDFLLPSSSAALDWAVRFESANYRAQVWLNGRALGGHTGGYLPFELPLAGLVRNGVNHLVVRVDNRRNDAGGTQPIPPNGWWNYGGLLREVYIRKIDQVDIGGLDVRAAPGCGSCPASVDVTATLTNHTAKPLTVHLAGRYGSTPIDLGTVTLPARASRSAKGHASIPHPKLWAPGRPSLYTLRLGASVAGRTVGGYTVLSGIRSIRVSGGRLLFNGRPLRFRGVAVHEDASGVGAALGNDQRAQIIALARDLGANELRAHYPLHPELEELADRAGILLWSEVPVYQLGDQQLGRPAIRRFALGEVHDNVINNRVHPSVLAWSIANELPPTAGLQERTYIQQAAAVVRRLDPTRPVAMAFQVRPSSHCQAAYKPLDLLGINDYFGWYTGLYGEIADRDGLSSYLDVLRRCYPRQALAITEFGAEANRDGPVEEKGTYAFQSQFIQFAMGVYASKSWLTGTDYWTLQEFKVRPDWNGGNPLPDPPMHEKGLVSYAGVKKPAYAVLQAIYRAAARRR